MKGTIFGRIICGIRKHHNFDSHHPVNPYSGKKSKMADVTVCKTCDFWYTSRVPDFLLRKEANYEPEKN